MDEIEFYKHITGEWICANEEGIFIFKYDGFRMYKRVEDEWVETHEWWLVTLTESSKEVTGIDFKFLGLPQLLLKNYDENPVALDFERMLTNRLYHFKKYS